MRLRVAVGLLSAELVDLHSKRIFQEIMGFVRKVDFTLLTGEGITHPLNKRQCRMVITQPGGRYQGTGEAQLPSQTSAVLFPVIEMPS